jgi:hypothetical protein
MRDEFLMHWGIDADSWNEACDGIGEFAHRQGGGMASGAYLDLRLPRRPE